MIWKSKPRINTWLFLACILNFATPSFAEEDHFEFHELQVGGTLAVQGGGFSIGPELRYTPHYLFRGLDKMFAVGLDLGISAFDDESRPTFVAIQYGAFVSYHSNATFEARLFSLGAQTWTGGNGTAFYLGPELLYHFAEKIWGYGDAVYFSYRGVFENPISSLISLGIQLKF